MIILFSSRTIFETIKTALDGKTPEAESDMGSVAIGNPVTSKDGRCAIAHPWSTPGPDRDALEAALGSWISSGNVEIRKRTAGGLEIRRRSVNQKGIQCVPMATEDPKLMNEVLSQIEKGANVRGLTVVVPGYDERSVMEHIVIAYDRQFIKGADVTVYGEPRRIIPTDLLPAGRDFLKAQKENTFLRKAGRLLGKVFVWVGIPYIKKWLGVP